MAESLISLLVDEALVFGGHSQKPPPPNGYVVRLRGRALTASAPAQMPDAGLYRPRIGMLSRVSCNHLLGGLAALPPKVDLIVVPLKVLYRDQLIWPDGGTDLATV